VVGEMSRPADAARAVRGRTPRATITRLAGWVVLAEVWTAVGVMEVAAVERCSEMPLRRSSAWMGSVHCQSVPVSHPRVERGEREGGGGKRTNHIAIIRRQHLSRPLQQRHLQPSQF